MPSFSGIFSGTETSCELGAQNFKISNRPAIDPKDEDWVFATLMRWKALDRAMNMSEVPAPGDAAFRATLLRQLATDFLGRLVEVRIARS